MVLCTTCQEAQVRHISKECVVLVTQLAQRSLSENIHSMSTLGFASERKVHAQKLQYSTSLIEICVCT